MQHAMLPGVELFNNFKEYQAHEHYTHKYHELKIHITKSHTTLIPQNKFQKNHFNSVSNQISRQNKKIQGLIFSQKFQNLIITF